MRLCVPPGLLRILFFLAFLAGPAQVSAAPVVPPYQVYLPQVSSNPGYSISGQVVDYYGQPLAGITLNLSNGQQTVSDAQGNYSFQHLPAGTYTYSAVGWGYSFLPLQRSATLPPNLSGKIFTNQTALPVSLNLVPYFHSQVTETSLGNACGPASLMMTLDYWGLKPGSLNDVIQAASYPPLLGGFDSTCTYNPVCLSAAVLTSVAQNQYRLNTDAHDGWTFDLLLHSLALGHPVVTLVNYGLDPYRSGHFVVVYGADPLTRSVSYNDPFDGPGRQAAWSKFYTSWYGPVDADDPLQRNGHHAWGMAVWK